MMKLISEELLDSVSHEARESSRLRMNYNFHESLDSPIPSAGVYGVEIPSGIWHSIIAFEPGTVIFEIKSGPYKPLPPEDIAPWAPAPSDLEGAAVFMKRMLEV